jgi:hypothetical protein
LDIKYLGFNVKSERDNLPLSEFVEKVNSSEDSCIKFREPDSNNGIRIYLHDSEHFIKGLVVTIKDQQKFCKLAQDGLEIEVENLVGDDKLLEFNFFVLNKSNNIGLYQYYHQSCGLSRFINLFKRQYRAVSNSNAETQIEIEKARAGSITKRKEKGIRANYYDWLHMTQLIKQEDIEEILNQCAVIKSLTYDYTYVTDSRTAASPLNRYVDKKTLSLNFKRTQSLTDISRSLTQYFDGENITKGRVNVEDHDGNSFGISISNIPDCFGVDDYDRLVNRINGLNINRFFENQFFDILIDKYSDQDYQRILDAETVE